MSVIRLKNNRYEIRVYQGIDPLTTRKKYRYKTARTKEAAKQLEKKMMRERNLDENYSQVSLRRLIDLYLDTLPRQQIKTSIDKHLNGFGRNPASQVTPYQLQTFYQSLPIQPASAQRIHGVIHAAYNYALKNDWLMVNPAARAKPPSIQRRDPQVPTVQQVQRVLEVATGELALYIRIAATTGARKSEILSMKGEDIDRGRKLWRKYDSKTGMRYSISLDEDLIGRLPYEGPVFSYNRNYYNQEFLKLQRKHGLYPTFPLRNLRHFVATQLIGAGVDYKTVSRRLGHAKTSTTLDIYAGYIDSNDEPVAGLLRDILEA